MAERTVVDLVEDWQTGFFVVLGCLLAGVVAGYLVGSAAGPSGYVTGFLAGAIAAFLGYSYLRYGR